MKRFLSLALSSIIACATLSGCGGSAPAQSSAVPDQASQAPVAAGAVELKFGHVDGTDSPKQVFAEKLNELLKEKMGGRIQLTIYPNSQLGGERDLIEGVQMGSVDMSVVANTVAANFVPSLMAVEFPYLINSYEQADAVFQGEIGQSLLNDINNSSMIGIGFMEAGFRNYSNNKHPVNSIDDVKGMRLRVMENDLHQELWKALGADAVTMSWADAYTSIQQGAIDGIEVPNSITFANNVQDVCKYIAVTHHIYTAAPVLMSNAAYEKIPQADREQFTALAREAAAFAVQKNRNIDEECLKKLQDAGMEVTRPDLEPFKTAVSSVYGAHEGEYKDIISKIQALG